MECNQSSGLQYETKNQRSTSESSLTLRCRFSQVVMMNEWMNILIDWTRIEEKSTPRQCCSYTSLLLSLLLMLLLIVVADAAVAVDDSYTKRTALPIRPPKRKIKAIVIIQREVPLAAAVRRAPSPSLLLLLLLLLSSSSFDFETYSNGHIKLGRCCCGGGRGGSDSCIFLQDTSRPVTMLRLALEWWQYSGGETDDDKKIGTVRYSTLRIDSIRFDSIQSHGVCVRNISSSMYVFYRYSTEAFIHTI